MIDRRSLLILIGSTPFLKLSFASLAAAQPHLVRISAYIPRRLFFPTRSPGSPVSLTALELINEEETASCSFSNGKTIQLDSNSSSFNITRERKGRVTRQSVLPKSLAAWVIDAVWRSVRNKRNPATGAHLRGNFESFQRQAVLEAVTPASLYNLVRDSALRNQITSVAWKEAALRFEVK